MSNDAEIAASLAHFDFDSEPLGDDKIVITCRRVWNDGVPVGYVSHDEDGGYQFICLGNEHTSASEVVHVCAKHIFERGPDQLRDFAYLRRGSCATHVDGETWELAPVPPDDP